jgi:DNA-binding HxlR family transcriptional regulator
MLVPTLQARKTAPFSHWSYLMETFLAPDEPGSFAECTEAIIPVSEVLAQISSKWSILVIAALTHGPRRFSELKRSIEGVSQKMLTSTLRDLERDGFVTRTVTPSIPPRVDYELTEMGQELKHPISAIGQWAHANHDRVVAARSRFEERQTEARSLAW